MKIKPCSSLKGEIMVPGDKSISHRCIMFASLAKGISTIHHFLNGADCLATIQCFTQLGISIEEKEDTIYISGKGLYGLQESTKTLDCQNSGTTMRLLSGILSAQPFSSTLDGDSSIRKRPMNRIAEPLSLMGAHFQWKTQENFAPFKLSGTKLQAIEYTSPVASAQVKSAVLLAGLYAQGQTKVIEPELSRNHTEILLRSFGAEVVSDGCTHTIMPEPNLVARDIFVPGDISSAAYFIAAGLLSQNAQIYLQNVGINPSRDGILKVCKQMGANIQIFNEHQNDEPTADLLITPCSHLTACTIDRRLIPSLIDELPIIAVIACFAEGTTIIKDASELKVKESNRIHTVVKGLSDMGADIQETEDGMIIHGGKPLHCACIDSKGDHRIAMSFSIAALFAEGESEILNSECVNVSYPHFYSDLFSLIN
ncbi:3-phosphoshikimate 1-carboxyvinyltransferase [Clostridia bacterium]|nr:3-phosphoshikimate 1-carboxyvinyltransferase [Clostridia bacterium]